MPVCVLGRWQGQAKLADHVRKSYSVNDLSLESSSDFVDNREDLTDDDEVDNRLVAEQYNRELAEMTGAQSRRPLNQGLI